MLVVLGVRYTADADDYVKACAGSIKPHFENNNVAGNNDADVSLSLFFCLFCNIFYCDWNTRYKLMLILSAKSLQL